MGVALPYSIASRLAKGGTFGKMFGHAVWRSILLVALGVFLRSMHSTQTYFTFEDTLSQIGLGYPILFFLGFRPPKWQWIALTVILVGYWAAWALYPVAGPGFDWQSVGVPADWQHFYPLAATGTRTPIWGTHSTSGPESVSAINPFVFNSGGYLTLSFIPTLGKP